MENEIVIYQPNNTIHLEVMMEEETVWLTQNQMVELYERDISVISRHIQNVFKDGEVDKESNLHFLQIANSDRPVAFYSLDVIISVGCRVKSKRGVEFRKWANSVLSTASSQYIVSEDRVDHILPSIVLQSSLFSLSSLSLPPHPIKMKSAHKAKIKKNFFILFSSFCR
ncbi:virulence RhuM family protein [bacterium]|nr:virulence RhuM family protein [bacterium]